MIDSNKLRSWIVSAPGTWLLFIVWNLFITNLWLPRNWGFYGNGDWDLTYTTYEVARKSIVEFGQIPHYNPFLAFGSDLDANPQAAHWSIFFLPVLIFGTFYGYKVSILMALLIGLHGFNRLLKYIGIDPMQALLYSFIFCSSSYLAQHSILAGHSNFLNFYLVPFLFLYYQRYIHTGKFRLLSIPVLILMQFICGGAPFIFIVVVVMLLLWLCGLAINGSIGLKKGLLTLTSLGFAIGMSLWKLIPVMQLWEASPRLVTDDSQINLLVWLHALNDSSTDTGTPHQWHEISIGVGILMPILILVYRRYIPNFKLWLGFCAIIIWIGLGNQPNFFNPWYLLHHTLPFFNGLRAPYRFAFIILFAIVIGAAIITNKLKDNKLIYIVLISITLSNSLNYNALSRNLVHTPRIDEIKIENDKEFALKNMGEDYPYHYLSVKKNQFLVSAYEPMHLPAVNDTLNTFIKGGELTKFTSNSIAFKSMDSLSIIALRWQDGWKAKGNLKISNWKGLMAIQTTPGTVVELNYHNPAVDTGLNYSLVVFLLFLISFYPFRFLQIATESVSI